MSGPRESSEMEENNNYCKLITERSSALQTWWGISPLDGNLAAGPGPIIPLLNEKTSTYINLHVIYDILSSVPN